MSRTSRVRHAAIVLSLVVSARAATPAQQPAPVTVRASVQGGLLYPGDLALVVVTTPRPTTAVDGTAFGRALRFWHSDTADDWQGFVGIDLETRPGTYGVSVRAISPGGETVAHVVPLTVREKRFETRRLTVSSKFVDPPAAEADRIAREAELLASLFTQTGTDRLWRGPFVVPVPGRATSSFGRLSVLNGTPRGRHQGADFAATVGTPVHAPNAGRVVLAQDLYFSGNTVVLDHGVGLFSLLAHMSRLAVTRGQMVAAGDTLGEAGATGRVTGPHVHWAVRLGEFSVNPMSLMAAVAHLDDTPPVVARQ
jgi:hypothetical protein